MGRAGGVGKGGSRGGGSVVPPESRSQQNHREGQLKAVEAQRKRKVKTAEETGFKNQRPELLAAFKELPSPKI